MNNKGKKKILNRTIEELNFSTPFHDVMVQNSFVTLEDLLKVSFPELLQLPGVSKHILAELLSFLEEYDLTKSLRHEP